MHQAPASLDDARASPCGRPPIAILAFGFGGKAVFMRPKASPVLSTGGKILAYGLSSSWLVDA